MTQPTQALRPGGRFDGVDAMRGIAATAVLAFHANGLFWQYQWRGGLDRWLRYSLSDGVILFFAVSGSLITRPFVLALLSGEALPGTADHARRRAARLLPAYWLVLFVWMAAVAPAGVAAWQVVTHGVLVHNFIPGQATAVYGVAWTLGIEAMFYVAVPVVALLLRRRRRVHTAEWLLRATLMVFAASTVISTAGVAILGPADAGPWAMWSADSLPATLRYFCAGIALGICEQTDWSWYRRLCARPGRLVVAAVLCWVASVAVAHSGAPRVLAVEVPGLLTALGSGLALAGVLHLRGRSQRVAVRLAPLGVISYGIYLWHPVVARFMAEHGLALQTRVDDVSWLLNTALVLALTVVPAALSLHLVERPAIAWAAARRERRVLVPVEAAS